MWRWWIGFAMAAGAAWGQCPAGGLTAGYRVVNAGPMTMAVWYPATVGEASVAYSPNLSGMVARNAAPATCERFPVVLFAHGFNGCGTQSVFLTEELARRGYVVVAPDYRDAGCSSSSSGAQNLQSINPARFTDPASWTDQTYVDRRDDSRRAIEAVLADAALGSAADGERMAVVGHSLGGYTGAALVGGWASWLDRRLKAALLLSPYVDPYLVNSRNQLSGVAVPVMYQGGTLDIGITPSVTRAGGAYDTTGRPKYFLELRAASHFEWTNLTCGLTPTTVSRCLAASRNARLIVDYSAAFLEQHVRGRFQPMLFAASAANDFASYRREMPLAMVSAASLRGEIAPDSLVSGFSLGLAGTRAVTVIESTGRSRTAPVFFAADQQMNLVLPADVAPGRTQFQVRDRGELIAAGEGSVAAVAPGVFTVNGGGTGVAAAQFLRVRPNGTRETGLILDPRSGQAVAVSTAAGVGELYLILYGTGFRGGSGAEAKIGGVATPVLGFAAQPEFAGLDQVALGPVPGGVRGLVNIEFTVSGRAANVVTALLE